MTENFRNLFCCVLWLIVTLEKWLLGFSGQNLIFRTRFYVLVGPTVWFWMVFATLSSKWTFKCEFPDCAQNKPSVDAFTVALYQ